MNRVFTRAVMAAMIGAGSTIVALFLNDPLLTFGAITQGAWVGMIGGAVVQAAKDVQASMQSPPN